MRYLTIILWLCLTNLGLAQWSPVDFKKWQATEDSTTFQQRIGGAIQNYPETDTSWAEIENDWVLYGDTMTARHAYMKTDVLPNGISQISIEHNDTTYMITQKPVRLIWLKTNTWNWIDVADMPNWGTPTVNNDVISWTNVFPGVDYKIQKRKGRVDHGIFFKQGFLDSAIVLYDQREDSLDIALANVMEYTLSANIDSADIGIGNVNKRILKRIGKYVFGMARSELHFPGSDTLQLNLVNHRWVKQGGKIYCIEYIKMRIVKMVHETYPTATIWHNASPHTIEGTTNVEDCYISSSSPTNNYGSSALWGIVPTFRNLSRVKNVASELGGDATISAATYNFYNYSGTASVTIGGYRIFKPWYEGDHTGQACGTQDCSWNGWNCSAAYSGLWTTAGCESADDGGSDNSGNGTGADRKETEEGTAVIDAVEWVVLSVTSALAQGWYDETINEEGIWIHRISGDTGNKLIRSTEHGSDQPYWVFTYTTGGAPTGRVIIIN